MTETMTQEALLDLIYAYAEAQVLVGLTAAMSGGPLSERAVQARREATDVHMAVLDAVRSLPIEAGR